MGQLSIIESLRRVYNSLNTKISGKTDVITSVTYSELVDLRDDGELIPGNWYRITDFVTTVNSDLTDVQSAGHAFDLLVQATDVNILSTQAKAIQHEGDEYFALSHLDKWQIWYSLDNDVLYNWADTINGKGVIFRMIDEWNNDHPYDFKNIMFKRWKVDYTGKDNDPFGFDGQYIGIYEGDQNLPDGYKIDDEDSVFLYRYTMLHNGEEITDNSIGLNVGALLVLGYDLLISLAMNNKSETCLSTDLTEKQGYLLDNTVHIGIFDSIEDIYNIAVVSNKFDVNCFNNSFLNMCFSNTLGLFCSDNIFGGNCNGNTFGDACSYNTFGCACYSNTFSNDCRYITFGNDCYSNTFGDDCSYNTFGDYSNYNTFGDACSYNIFGCDCYSNTFSDYCSRITFGSGVVDNAIIKDYMRYITLENGVYCVNITCTDTTSDSTHGQNILVHSGVRGTSNARKTCSISTAGNDFLTEFGTVVQGTIS